jgi:hypothetical protein
MSPHPGSSDYETPVSPTGVSWFFGSNPKPRHRLLADARGGSGKTGPRGTVCAITNRSSDCLLMRRSGDNAACISRSPGFVREWD